MPFDSRADQVMHYKLDWHKYNVKRRVSGRNPISQEDFERISGMATYLYMGEMY